MNKAAEKLIIILGDQLFPLKYYAPFKESHFFMAEDYSLCTHYKYHKLKLTFFLSCMRNYRDEMIASDYSVTYQELNQEIDFFKALKAFLKKEKINQVKMFEVHDKFFEKKITHFLEELNCNIEFMTSPAFLCDRKNFKDYLHKVKKPFMKTFYERERLRFNLMLNSDLTPWGGQWSFDQENRKPPPKSLTLPKRISIKRTKNDLEVKNLIEISFKNHPGELHQFWMATTRVDAVKELKFFLEHHLKNFGLYQDSITNKDDFLFHSLLSPYLNCGLLTPKEVIASALKFYAEKDNEIPLSSLEGFVRQVIGWREFVMGIYQNFSEQQESFNFFGHDRLLTKDWYDGTTGLPPVDDAIKKAKKLGYCHHIERLMILSNVMLLMRVHPKEVHKWFMEMFIDSADWVMGPNVYGMGQFSDGGIFATKPYISGSNYIIKMSDYKKGEWSDIWDALFWNFVSKNQKFLQKNYRLAFMVKTYEKFSTEKKHKYAELAENYIHSKTALRQ